jgi:hypothetical protein
MFDSQTHSRGTDVSHRATYASASMKKASSTTNIVDDLSAIFGGGTDHCKTGALQFCYASHPYHKAIHLIYLYFWLLHHQKNFKKLKEKVRKEDVLGLSGINGLRNER